MERTTWSWAHKAALAVVAFVVACCCVFLSGCAENSEEAARNAVTSELDQIKNVDAAAIEEIAGGSAEFQALSTYGITANDAYEAIFSDFDYQIEGVKVDGDKATVSVKFTSKDLGQFQSALVAAAQQASTDGSLTGLSQTQMNEKIGQLVIDTIKALPTTETDIVDFEVEKKNGKWQLADNSGEVLQEAIFPSSLTSGY